MKWYLIVFFGLCLFFPSLGSAGDAADSNGRFQVFEDGTVLDRQTDLMWATQDNGEDVNWQEAENFCKSYSKGGYNDWRLPTQRELITLFDSSSPEKFKTFPPFTFTSCCPWTSDKRRTEARSIFFMMGERVWYKMTESEGFRALPVRNAKKNN